MLALLVIGLGLLAAAAFVGLGAASAARMQRRRALLRLRGVTETRRPVLLPRAVAAVARVYARVAPGGSLDRVRRRLDRAGAAQKLSPEAFVAGQVALASIGLAFGLVVGRGAKAVIVALLFGGIAAYLPHLLLSRAAQTRIRRIEKALPAFLDQLAIAVEAGMSFDSALLYLLRATNGPLPDELRRVANEMRVGAPRREALVALAERLDSDDVSYFVHALIASDQLGTPIAEILKAQAADARNRHQMRAEEQAQKTPVKILFPVVLFILPVMFVVVLGPGLIQLQRYL
ncbi:MAG TPA: type II secretion system F family protein [Gaiellaceae bacterium]|nr:type II secretion system F family protein [Gaiellaceae bacterium]